MEYFKRQSSTSFNDYDDRKRQKIQTTTYETNCLSEKTVACFEDLSNELIYEIFEFLDYFDVYEAFFNLNIRFHNLLTNSNLPIKINISSMSKSDFKRYSKDIIETSIDRINLLHFSNVFMYDFVFSSIDKLSDFRRIETLIIQNIESCYLENLLDQLSSLSLLSSLIITSVDHVRNKNTIYRQIFDLSALKYCKLSLFGSSTGESLPVSVNKYSSIERLIINDSLYVNELDSMLSYVPQLRHLSLDSLFESWNERTTISPNLLKQLTHIYLDVKSVKFHKFEQLVINIFRNVQHLRLTVNYYNADTAYMDANKWKQLIISHIPNLRIFDIQFDISANNNDDRWRIETQINQFTTPFWIERRWSFGHHFYHSMYGNRVLFYSTNPYRRKNYTLYKQLNDDTSLHNYESNLNSVKHIHIQSEKSIMNCMNYFPNATELTFQDGFATTRASVGIILNRIIPLKQLTKLVIEFHHFSVNKLIELLYLIPNIHTLIFESMPFYKKDYMSIEQSETFQLISSRNNITNVTFKDKCILEQMKLLVALCPRVQHLSINTLVRTSEPITRFLLDQNNQNTRHLCSLCFSRASNNWLDKFDTLIKSETLLDDYILKLVGGKLYLWW